MLVASPSTSYLLTPCRPPEKGSCAAVFCSFLAPALPQIQETGLHLSSSCPIAPLPLSAPFSEFLSAFPCQIEVPQIQRPRCIHVLPPVSVLSFPALGHPFPCMAPTRFSPFELFCEAFKHRETMLQDQTAPTQTNH